MNLWNAKARCLAILLMVSSICSLAWTQSGEIRGRVVDPQSTPVAEARVLLLNSAGERIAEAASESDGKFRLSGIPAGVYQLAARAHGFVRIAAEVSLASGEQKEMDLCFQQIASVREQVTVVASEPSTLTPDPSTSIFIHDQVLDANPGRPGAPLSIPGLPIETASGGIKAPQYFAPGVAGDHGEPIAQFYDIGDFLYPNNLPANAHGNGYADPNFLIAPTIEGVRIDGGAFNVREGNNSIDIAAAYVPRQQMTSFVQLTGDYRDGDAMAGWSPADGKGWIAGEFSFGDGLLDRLEHRKQYKLNGFRQFDLGQHQLTVFGVGYSGFSDIPGLIPIGVPVPGDTIDNRQLDRTHTFLGVVTDNWKLGEQKQISFSGFVRNYALTLRSDFSDGLIQQSEDRNVIGGETAYTQSVRKWMAVLAGVDLRRDAPRNLDLKHIDDAGQFQPVTSNNLTLAFLEPFVSVDGPLGRYLHYNAGVRQENVWMDNQDLTNPVNSSDRLATLTLPKATMTVLPPEHWYAPTVAFSYGEAFHTNDPRIGTGTGQPTLLAPSRAYQLVVSKTVKQTRFEVTLRRISNSLELAKIDPDTGLQEVVGPSLNRVISVSLQRHFSAGSLYISFAQADARDRETGEPIPEAPRMIWDAVGSLYKLPLRLQARGEFEYVKAKPLGDGFTGVPVTEIRGAVLRPFLENRMSIGTNFLIANGYTGQTTEVLALPTDSAPFERAVGVPQKSYVSLSWAYYFKR